MERTSELLRAASSNVLRFKIDSQLPVEFRDKARVTGRIVQLPAHDAHEIERYLAIIRQAAGMLKGRTSLTRALLREHRRECLRGR